jgi:hypothetical protein
MVTYRILRMPEDFIAETQKIPSSNSSDISKEPFNQSFVSTPPVPINVFYRNFGPYNSPKSLFFQLTSLAPSDSDSNIDRIKSLLLYIARYHEHQPPGVPKLSDNLHELNNRIRFACPLSPSRPQI